jgi:hypothetical protein
MSDRVSVTVNTSPSSPPSAGPVSGRYFIVGQTQKGSTTPTIVRSMREYIAEYGARTVGPAMYDAAELALRSGVAELVVTRATGPSPVRASADLESGDIVVTAKDVGAFANSFTAAYVSSTKTLTVVTDVGTETYTGATIAALLTAVNASTTVTAASTNNALPSSDVTAVTFTSGTDDFSNVVWATTLGTITPDLGPGAIATPGVAHGTSGQALATHAAANDRLGLVTVASGSALSAATSAASTVRGYTNSTHLALVWPYVTVPDGTGATRAVDPTAFAAGLRARAHAVGIGESALAERYARQVVDVAPEVAVTSANWATANAARISVVRTVAGVTRLYSWQTVDAAKANLLPAQYRDMINALSYGGSVILESYVGQPGTAATYSAAAGELSGFLSGYGAYLQPRISGGIQVDPGYVVSVSGGNDPADNRIAADVSIRFAESVEFVDFTIAVGDANAVI